MLYPHLRRPSAAFRATHPAAQLSKLEVRTEAIDQLGDVELVTVIASRPITDGIQTVAWAEVSEGSDGNDGHWNKIGTFIVPIQGSKFDGFYLRKAV